MTIFFPIKKGGGGGGCGTFIRKGVFKQMQYMLLHILQVLKAERPDVDEKRSDLLKLQGKVKLTTMGYIYHSFEHSFDNVK